MSAMQETLSRIAGLARSGRLDQAAIEVAGAAAGQAAPDPVLAALGGAIESRRGQFARAADYLGIAHRAHPGDLTVRANLVEALFRTGRGAEALELCDEAGARADPSLRIARLGAHLAQEAGELDRAVSLYRLVVEREPKDWAAWNNLGNTLESSGDYAAAADALQRAADLAPDSPPIRLNLGSTLISAGRYEDGERVLQALAADYAEDPKPLLALYGFYRRAGIEDKGFAALAAAAGRDPADAAVQADLGYEASRLGKFDIAERAFDQALAIDPALGRAYVGKASTLERTNREELIAPLYDRAVAAGIEPGPLAFIKALWLRREGKFEDALEALALAGEAASSASKASLRGSLLDRLGRQDEAFAAFEDMNQLALEDYSRPAEKAQIYRDVVAHGRALATPAWYAGWCPAGIDDGMPDPVILLGFPRSGTTLLDTMLMSDPGTGVLEEERFIADLEREVGGIDALPGLSADQIAAARASYFDRVGKAVDLTPGTTIVDKHPLHLNKVPIIQRLFPRARYILALRHPCDALLSCFITNFRSNHAMSNFLELETGADLYDMTFSYWSEARETFGLDVRTVVYERLVEDTARELVPLFDWLGLTWPEAGLDHRAAARARGTVRTASYAQVTEPVYTRSAGRWKRYEKHLAPIFPVIAPWVEKFGYSLEDGRNPPWPEDAAG